MTDVTFGTSSGIGAAPSGSLRYTKMLSLDDSRTVAAFRSEGTSPTPKRVNLIVFDNSEPISAGAAKTVGPSLGEDDVFDICMVDTDKFICFYTKASSFGIFYIIFTVSGTTLINAGTGTIASGNIQDGVVRCKQIATNKVVVCAVVSSTSSCELVCGTISGGTLTPGTTFSVSDVSSSTTRDNFDIIKVDTDKFVLSTRLSTSDFRSRVYNISGTTISQASNTNTLTDNQDLIQLLNYDTNKFILFYRNRSNSNYFSCRFGSINGSDEITYQSADVILEENRQLYDIKLLGTDKVVMMFGVAYFIMVGTINEGSGIVDVTDQPKNFYDTAFRFYPAVAVLSDTEISIGRETATAFQLNVAIGTLSGDGAGGAGNNQSIFFKYYY